MQRRDAGRQVDLAVADRDHVGDMSHPFGRGLPVGEHDRANRGVAEDQLVGIEVE